MGLGERVALGCDIAVVEAVEINVDFFEKFKKHTHSLLSVGDGIRAIIPRHQSCATAERIGKRIAHDMPIRRRKAQMLAHCFALDEFVGVVVFKCKGIFCFGAFVGDFWDFREVGHGLVSLKSFI